MDFRLNHQQSAFQQEVISFIETEMRPGWEQRSYNDSAELTRHFSRLLSDRRWLALPWPVEYGGMAASPVQQMIFNEQMSYYGVPGSFGMGVAWVGPILMLYGNPEQKARFLPPIAKGEEVWCTLYSEPGAGSDLASMQTRAVRDGDDYVVSGQKIWTSGAHVSDWGWLAARTDPSAPKHKGLSTFLVKMDTPGITIRPLVNMTGNHEFNEVFFENVRIPRSQLVGEENRGWYNLAVALDFERSSIGATSNARRKLDDIVKYLRSPGAQPVFDQSVRHRLADISIGVQILRTIGYHIASAQERTGIAPTREAQMAKLFGAELQQRLTLAALQAFGMEGQATLTDRPASSAAFAFLRAVAHTIEGGTSEIQRSVIATRGLGLPRE